jgi:multiple sugar transport system substrate-binding protein
VHVEWVAEEGHSWATVPFDEKARSFDLLVIDHPFVGHAVASRSLVPFETLLPDATLAGISCDSVGRSQTSYEFEGATWALSIDAATQVSAFREDLLKQKGIEPPTSVEELLSLAASGDLTYATPGRTINVLMTFLALCGHFGANPCAQGERRVVDRAVGESAAELLFAIYRAAHPMSRASVPHEVLEAVAQSDEVDYGFLVYSYVNYADVRLEHPLAFRPAPIRSSVLGGTGIAVSSFSNNPHEAAEFAAWVCGPAIQRGVYFDAGGQPARRTCWLDDRLNRSTNGFFASTLDVTESAYLRPRFSGFVEFQNRGAQALCAFLDGDHNSDSTLAALDVLYQDALDKART